MLVLCEETDTGAIWAADRLRQVGLAVRVVTGAALATAARWEHRVGRDGATLEVRLADGTRLSSADIGPVLNRLSFVPSAWLRRVGGPDRDYAVQEIQALYLSWLHALPGPVLNPPTPQGLCGNWRHPSAWAAFAGRAGLPAAWRQSSEHDPGHAWPPSDVLTAYVVANRVVRPPALPASLEAGCIALSRAAATPLLGIDFSPDAERAWRLAGVSVMPDLFRGGDALVDALAEAFAS